LTEPEHREEEPTEPKDEPAEPDPGKPRELTPEEREELRKKIERAREEDPNIYPIF
jgi:hypothetical protein